MINTLKRHNIKNVDSYVGWILLGDKLIHHCWMVYKDKHVLDPGVSKIIDIVKKRMIEENADLEQGRKIYLEVYSKTKSTPNSKLLTFGRVAPFTIYIGTQCKPDLGIQVFNDLMTEYPNHPSYRNRRMNPDGASELQKMIYREDFK